MEDLEWYDDSPMFSNPEEREALELSQLRPLSEWLTFDEVFDLHTRSDEIS